jgi:hypothetical protein
MKFPLAHEHKALFNVAPFAGLVDARTAAEGSAILLYPIFIYRT